MTPAPTINMPRLTLHIEADTLAELMDALDAVMGQLDPDHISAIRTATTGNAVELDVYGSKAEADAAADATKRGRGRPRKEAAPAAAPAAVAPAPAAAPVVADPLAHATQPQPAAAPADLSTMQTLSPADARKKGIEMIQAHFANNPGCLPQITAISAKFGVTEFAAIPDPDAHRFLADIALLVNGSGQV